MHSCGDIHTRSCSSRYLRVVASTRIHIHRCIRTCIHTCIHTCLAICISIRLCFWISIRISTPIRIGICIDICVFIRTHIRTCIHTPGCMAFTCLLVVLWTLKRLLCMTCGSFGDHDASPVCGRPSECASECACECFRLEIGCKLRRM